MDSGVAGAPPTTAQVRDWMTSDPLTVTPDTELMEARALLEEHGFRHLPVVDGDRLVGMVSDRDVRIDQGDLERLDDEHLLARIRSRRSVEAVMSSPVHVVEPDAPISEAARLMLSRRVSALPVVDELGDEGATLVGVVTTTDCLLALLDRG